MTNTRAQAYRILDTIAEKKKHPNGSYFWEVKSETLDVLGLTGIVNDIEVADAKQEAMKTIVRCVHNSTLPSKEKIVDEIRSSHENVTASRAEAMRIVQSIATKVKNPKGGFYWIVNDGIRQALGECIRLQIHLQLMALRSLILKLMMMQSKAKFPKKRKHVVPTICPETERQKAQRRGKCL